MNPILRFITFLEGIRDNRPILYKSLYYALWVTMPIEMLCIKLGLFGYKKFKENQFSNKTLERLR